MVRSLALLAALAISARAEASRPQFRGPAGASTAVGAELPADLDATKSLLWRAAIPPGASSPVIVGGRIILTGFAEGKLATLALNRADGSIAWRHEVTPGKFELYMEKLGSPAASTGATDGKTLVSYFGSHGLPR